MLQSLHSLVALLLIALAFAGPLVARLPLRDPEPQWEPAMDGQNFPDPSIVRKDKTWHAFSTESTINGRLIHVPQARSADLRKWLSLGTKDAMPDLAPWIDAKNPRVWAPDVTYLSNGFWIMYYTAMSKNQNVHCLGYARASDIEGPYHDRNTMPFICPREQGGAIDPAAFTDPKDGTRWLTYKVDGNSIGHGGSCNNGVAPIVPTPIMLQQLAADGMTLLGDPITILTNTKDDGPYVEAPSLARWNDDFVLFYSSHCYTSEAYDTKYAIASGIRGPYVRKGTLLRTGSSLTAPGGLDVTRDGKRALFHANFRNGRAMYAAAIGRLGDRFFATTMD